MYGNRGCLHDGNGQIRRGYAGKRWIACRLRFRGWHRAPLMQPGRFTELFFLDEATAFAAGHRPCALCRREDYDRFGAVWRELHPGDQRADDIDARLHYERIDPRTRTQRRHPLPDGPLPDGAFVLRGGAPHLVLGGRERPWTPAGYGPERSSHVRGELITPPSLLAILRACWEPAVPLLHPSVGGG